ncbi:hypothetical protein HCN44_002294 [Aphidius gifuensis]|uniref:Uncharacterized protein n=1 Tax=Aphidius gifuensis TaxID=684658 RepID=A0A835CWR6_APHGI|nr:hypothetical protein HCN44_002294 [Aphidius gifuensis]
MSYSGNMPDWHQYNPPSSLQSGRVGGPTVSSSSQNVNSSHHQQHHHHHHHLLSSSISPPTGTLLDRNTLTKHPKNNDVHYSTRNYPGQSGLPLSLTSLSTATSTLNTNITTTCSQPLSNCMSHHYGGTSSSTSSSSSSTIDPRLISVGLNDNNNNDLPGQLSLPPPPPLPPLPPPPTNKNNQPSNYTSNSTIINGQNETISSGRVGGGGVSAGGNVVCKAPCCNHDINNIIPYQHWGDKYSQYNHQANAISFREPPLLKTSSQHSNESRRYITSATDFRKECQSSNSTSSLNLQNSYYNSQLSAKNTGCLSARDYQESQLPPTQIQNQPARPLPVQPVASSSIHGSYQKYHAYQQKIAMHRYSIENHLRAMMRTPGYQSHPKYHEYVMRHRELVRLQQNIDYQNVLQETTKIPSTSPSTINTAITASTTGTTGTNSQMNIQNKNSIHPNFIKHQQQYYQNHLQHQIQQQQQQHNNNNNQQEQTLNLSRHPDSIHHNMMQRQISHNYQIPTDNERDINYDNHIVDVDGVVDTSSVITNTSQSIMDINNSREFANKPELDLLIIN